MKKAFKKIFISVLIILCFSSVGAVNSSAEITEVELLQTAVSHLEEDIDSLENALAKKADAEAVNMEISELRSITVVACIISCLSLVGSCAMAVYLFIDRRKRNRT